MFHLGGIVEEIATKRPGKIDSMSESRDHNGNGHLRQRLARVFLRRETAFDSILQGPERVAIGLVSA